MLETIPDAGHWLHAEQPAAFVRKVREFAFV
jgi:pimeloyl-ACP methyl ester carboxylesterase